MLRRPKHWKIEVVAPKEEEEEAEEGEEEEEEGALFNDPRNLKNHSVADRYMDICVALV
jgi:hypothetical protein